MSAEVLVRFIADTSALRGEIAQVEGTGNKLKSWAKGVGAAIGAGLAVKGISDAVNAAAELQDTISAGEVIFGRSAAAVQKWTDANANAFLMSKQQASDAANQFAMFGKSAGLSGKDLAGFSTDLTGLAGDLASFRGGTVEDAITAIGAAMRGENEPIRKYGVLLDDASLRAKALEMGLIDTTKNALTPQQKVLAANALIWEQTKDAQGDAARTADSAANQQRKLSAAMADTSAAIGTALLPVLSAVLPVVRSLAKFIGDNADVLVPLAAGIAAVTIAQWAWNAAMNASPLTLIVLGIAAVVAAVVVLIKNWDTVKEVALAVWDAILSAVRFVWDWLQQNWPLLLAILTGPFGLAVRWIIQNWDEILDFFRGIPGQIAGFLSGVWHAVTSPFIDAFNYVKGIWNAFARGWNSIQISLPSVDLGPLGHIGGKTIGLPDLPMLARGGIVTRPTLALIGERGPEAVIPLGARGGGAGTMIFNLDVRVETGASPGEVGARIVDAIRQYERVAGAAWRTSTS